MSSSSEDETELLEWKINNLRRNLLQKYKDMLKDPLLEEIFGREMSLQMSGAHTFLQQTDVSETTFTQLQIIETGLNKFHDSYLENKAAKLKKEYVCPRKLPDDVQVTAQIDLDSSSDEEDTGPIPWRMPRRLLPPERKSSLRLSDTQQQRTPRDQRRPQVHRLQQKNLPQVPRSSHQLQQNSPQLQQNSPQLQQISPQLQQNSPQLQQISPQLQQNSPQLQQSSPQFPQSSHQVHQISPQNMQSFSNNSSPNILQPQMNSSYQFMYQGVPMNAGMQVVQFPMNQMQQVPTVPFYQPFLVNAGMMPNQMQQVPANPYNQSFSVMPQQFSQQQQFLPHVQIPPPTQGTFNPHAYGGSVNSSSRGSTTPSPLFSPPIEYNVGASTSGTSRNQFQNRGQNGNRDPRSNFPNSRDPRAANRDQIQNVSEPKTYREHRQAKSFGQERQSRWDSGSNKRPSLPSTNDQQQHNNKQRRFDENSRRPDNNHRPTNGSREDIRLRNDTRQMREVEARREVDRVDARKPTNNNNTARPGNSRSEYSGSRSSRPESLSTESFRTENSTKASSNIEHSSRTENSTIASSSTSEISTTASRTSTTAGTSITQTNLRPESSRTTESRILSSKPPPQKPPKNLQATVEKIQGKLKQVAQHRHVSTDHREKLKNGERNSSVPLRFAQERNSDENTQEAEAIVQPEATSTTTSNSTVTSTQTARETSTATEATSTATEATSTATATPSQAETSTTNSASTAFYLPFNSTTSIPGLSPTPATLPLIPPEAIKKEKGLEGDASTSSTDKTEVPADLVIKTEIKTENNADVETDSNPNSDVDTASETSVEKEVNDDDDDDDFIAGLDEDPVFLSLARSSEPEPKPLTLEEEEEEDRLEQKQSFLRCRNFHELTETNLNGFEEPYTSMWRPVVVNSRSSSSPRYDTPSSPLNNDENWEIPPGENGFPEEDFDGQSDDDDDLVVTPMVPNLSEPPPPLDALSQPSSIDE